MYILELCASQNKDSYIVYEDIIDVLIACNLNFVAREEYRQQHYRTSDGINDKVSEKFTKSLKKFMDKPYFTFIKSGVLYSYRMHSRYYNQDQFTNYIINGSSFKLFGNSKLFS